MNGIIKSPTTWSGLAGIVTAVGGYFTGQLTLIQALGVGFTSLIGIFAADAKPKTAMPSQDSTLPAPKKE